MCFLRLFSKPKVNEGKYSAAVINFKEGQLTYDVGAMTAANEIMNSLEQTAGMPGDCDIIERWFKLRNVRKR